MRVLPACLALALVLALAACGPGTPPPTAGVGKPPQVAIRIDEGTVIAPSIKLAIDANGCERIDTVEIFQDQRSLKKVPFTQTPMEFEFGKDELRYESVVSQLSFNAKITCDDGRVGEAVPAAARFFPVVATKDGENGSLLVPQAFYPEGSGASVTFLGCAQIASGINTLVRVNREGQVLATLTNPPTQCTLAGYPTRRNATSGKRWWIEPNAGVFAVNDSMAVTAQFTGEPVNAAVQGPDGDLVFHIKKISEPLRLRRLSHASSTFVWQNAPLAPLVAQMVVANGFVHVADLASNIAVQGQFDLAVELFSYANGTIPSNGEKYIKRIPFSAANGTTPVVQAAFSEDGAVIFFSQPNGALPGSQIFGCVAVPNNSSDCTTVSGNQLWAGPATDEEVGLILPHAGGTRVAIGMAHGVMTLSAQTGQQIGQILRPSGSLAVSALLPGPQKELYMFDGLGGLPKEIYAQDDASLGKEAFRFDLSSGDLWAGTDDAGKLWLRIGTRLVEPLPTPAYRALPKP